MKAHALFGVCAIVLAMTAGPARAELVTNGSFATGDFSGWTNPAGSGVVIDQTFPAVADINDAAFTGSGTLSQVLATTPAASYDMSFSLLDESGFFADTFTVSFGTFSTTITGDMASSYTSETFLIPASDITGTSTTLSFQGTNLDADWNLDDVSVTPVATAIPEPPSGVLIVLGVLVIGSLAFRTGVRQI